MSTVQTQHKTRRIKSENKWGRSNRRHFARQNRRKKTSDGYEFEKKRNRKLILSRFTGDGWVPCPSGYTRGQGWGLLHKSWIGYKRAVNPRDGETFQDKLKWAIVIQNIQTDLGLQRAAFPTLGIEGDYIFAYSESKQTELENLQFESSLEEWEKKRRAHVKKIVGASWLSEQEKEWMEEYAPQVTTDITYNDNEKRYEEKITMPNLFDMVRRNRQP